MAGLGIDDALPRLIPAKTHAIIDYIHAGTNFLMGALFRRSNTRASNAAFALGAAVLANALMTDYPLGIFRLYSFKVHGALDYGVAGMSAAFPALLGIQDDPEAHYFYGQGLGEAMIAGVSNYADPSGSRRQWQRLGEQVRGRAAA